MSISLLVVIAFASFVFTVFCGMVCLTDKKSHVVFWPLIVTFITSVSWLSACAFQPWVVESVEFAEIQEKNNVQYIVFNYGDEIGFRNVTNLFNRVFKDEAIVVETYSKGPYAGLYFEDYHIKFKTQGQSFVPPPDKSGAVRIIKPIQTVPQVVPIQPEAPAEPEE